MEDSGIRKQCFRKVKVWESLGLENKCLGRLEKVQRRSWIEMEKFKDRRFWEVKGRKVWEGAGLR